MLREIFEVYAKVVDANGAYNTLNGYPKVYDSHLYNDDIDKARNRAYGEFHSVLGSMFTRDDRQCQIAMIIRASDGMQIERVAIGEVAEIPDPAYQVTVTSGSGSGTYTIGSIVNIVADEVGATFLAWEGAEGLSFVVGDATTAEASFIMPSSPVTLTATYTPAEPAE